jgi:hypothetical protein
MEMVLKQFKQIIIIAMLVLCVIPAIAQVKRAAPVRRAPMSKQLAEFYHLTAQANVTFTFPKGFREIKAPDDEDFSFDYAMELPGKDFEIWFRITPEKEDWTSFERAQNKPNGQLANPDSSYKGMGAAQSISFTGDNNYFLRIIPQNVLDRYSADAGRSYLLTLLDLPETKHYKYALLITLQKNHTGTILAVCFTNEKGPEFFKNIDKASNCLKFKTQTP